MKPTSFFLILCICLVSCSGSMKAAYGIKKPKVENTQSIQRALEKFELNKANNYTYAFEEYRRNVTILRNGIPDIMIFSKTGRLIPYGDEYACNAAAFNFIETLNPNRAYDVNPELTLSMMLNGLADLSGKPVVMGKNEDMDFTVLLFWTVYPGSLNKDHVKVWEEQALTNKQADIRVMKINMDFQEHWGAENLRKIMSK